MRLNKRLSFNFDEGVIEKFNSLVPEFARSRAIRNFLLKEYKLPEDINTLPLKIEGKNEVYPFIFNARSIEKLDSLVKDANRQGVIDVNRSVILRDVLYRLIERFTVQPFPPRKLKRNVFKVDYGTIEQLDKYIPGYERSLIIEDFILEGYEGPTVSAETLRQRPETNQDMNVSMDVTAFDVLGHYVDLIGTKGVTKAAIFRDVLQQLLKQLKNENPKKNEIETRFVNSLKEYKTVADPLEIKETFNKYLVD
jgi:hypothetical protein